MSKKFNYKSERKRIQKIWLEFLGPFPKEKPKLNPKIICEEKFPKYNQIKVCLSADKHYKDDLIYAWLLIPHHIKEKKPAVLCLHPTTFGYGKDIVVGKDKPYPKIVSKEMQRLPKKFFIERSYAKHLAERGYITLAPDTLGDGERKSKNGIYDLKEFYQRYPHWSAVGKTIWDNIICIDYLHTLKYVDTRKIGVIGHSLGGHSAIFVAGFDERIKIVVSNGGCSFFGKAMEHWSRIPPPPELKNKVLPGLSYVYIPKLRPYLGNHEIPNPIEFWEVMSLICPRPLMYAGAAYNDTTPGRVEILKETWEGTYNFYKKTGFEDKIFYHIYPGEHSFPVRAREFIYNWIDEQFSLL